MSLAGRGITHIRADNPGPFTLTGTNTYVVGSWILDPGPALPEHLDAVVAAAGGAEGIVVTHWHADHVEAVEALREWLGDLPVVHGEPAGELEPVALPGHTPDHFGYRLGDVAFTGDAVLGSGSVYVAPGPGSMAGYLRGLRTLRAMDLTLLCPGHGPLIEDPAGKLDQYVEHRLDRERRLLEAFEEGLRSADELLDRVWDDAPAVLRPAAAVTLAAHLGKLEEEGRLPRGVEWPDARGWEV